jgi:tetratricopeptide (TPR) repeat protein
MTRDTDTSHARMRPDGRREPRMGWVEDLRFAGERPHPGAPRRASRWVWPIMVGVAMLLLGLLVFRRPLADWLWPETRAQELRDQAAVALAHGHLTASDGSGARELYEAALAIDPDRNDAREGLMRVAQAALAQARAAIAADRFADAHRALQLANALSVPQAQADALAAQLREREASRAGIANLLSKASAARRAHRLDGAPDAALPLFQRVLALQPDRLEALEGREDALADLLQQAQQHLQQGELPEAAAMIAAARGYDPGHGDLPAAQAQLARAIDQARQQADRDLRRARLADAGAGYQALLRIDPGDAVAQRGLLAVATGYAQRAQRLASNFDFVGAQAALVHARALAPDASSVAAAARHVARARQTQARLSSPLPARERQRRVHRVLDQAAAAQARGDLLTPPGDSAFDKLRAARAIAPGDAAVRRASARLLPAAQACFEEELRGNSLRRARVCLDAWIAIEGSGDGLSRARRRLAQRWLAVGDERLGAGDIQGATAALASARAVDPATPGIDAFSQRLQTASAGD